MFTENKIPIPDNHKRSLSVLSRHIENGIDDVENLLAGDLNKKLTEKIHKNIGNETRGNILELVSELRKKNEKMFNELQLDPLSSFEDRIVRGKIGHIWTILCDSTAEALKGYGKLTARQAELLNSHVKSLLETVDKLQSLIN